MFVSLDQALARKLCSLKLSSLSSLLELPHRLVFLLRVSSTSTTIAKKETILVTTPRGKVCQVRAMTQGGHGASLPWQPGLLLGQEGIPVCSGTVKALRGS